MGYLKHADMLPPAVCRLVARKAHGRRLKTNEEIAKDGGLYVERVTRLATRTSWEGVPLEDIDAFMTGCGVNPFDRRLTFEYLRKRNIGYINNLKPAQRKLVHRLLKALNDKKRRL